MMQALQQINWQEIKTIMTQPKFVYKSNITNGRYAEMSGREFTPTTSQRVKMALENFRVQYARIQHNAVMDKIFKEYD